MRPVSDALRRAIEQLDCADGGCWVWRGAVLNSGYPTIGVKVNGRWRNPLLHRFVYEAIKGPIPPGLDVDHTCRNRRCANPEHLEAVTRAVNLARRPGSEASRTHCPSGHPYAGRNLIVKRDGSRDCRTCDRKRKRDAYHRRKEECST